MGTVLTGYGDAADDHEGYAAQVLEDGSVTGTDSDQTRPRMIGQVVAACGCGWVGTTRYPTTELVDEAAEALALAEWDRDHARPTVEGLRAEKWDGLRILLRRLAASSPATSGVGFLALSPSDQRDALDATLTGLDHATELARQLRLPLGGR